MPAANVFCRCKSTFPDRTSCGDIFKHAVASAKKIAARQAACDSCVTSKRRCNLEQPCETCRKWDTICVYSGRLQTPLRPFGSHSNNIERPASPAAIGLGDEAFSNNTGATLGADFSYSWNGDDLYEDANDLALWTVFDNGASESATRDDPYGLASFDKTSEQSLEFLEKFKRNAGLIASFDCGTESAREHAYTAALRMMRSPSQESGISPTLQYKTDPLALKSHQLISLVEEVIKIKPRNIAITLSWSSVGGDVCRLLLAWTHAPVCGALLCAVASQRQYPAPSHIRCENYQACTTCGHGHHRSFCLTAVIRSRRCQDLV